MANKNETIKLLRSYPIIMGSKSQVSSSTTGGGGLRQQFIDRSMQKEIGLHRRTVAPPAGQTGYTFEWHLTFYTHPGMRREILVRPKHLSELVDRLHALAVGVAPLDDLDRRNTDWLVFHTWGLGGLFFNSSDVLKYLKRQHFSFGQVEGNIEAYGIHAVKRPVE